MITASQVRRLRDAALASNDLAMVDTCTWALGAFSDQPPDSELDRQYIEAALAECERVIAADGLQ